ncbi:MAG: hypothetical protein IPM82_31305 [Saprospiraceae bacterium]|nr:hypothetical protein [Saprospiraceae bacterium]
MHKGCLALVLPVGLSSAFGSHGGFPVKPFGYRRQHAVQVIAFEIGFHGYWVLISHGGKPLYRADLLQASKVEKAVAAAKERQCSAVLELSIIDWFWVKRAELCHVHLMALNAETYL